MYQFWFSHLNEKARWILDYKGAGYEAVTFSPGMHIRGMQKLSGQTATPVVVADDEVIVGSGAIGEFIDAAYPGRALLPQDPAERERVLELCAWFDDRIGAYHRRALFHFMFNNDRGAVAALFTIGESRMRRFLYTLGMPILCGMLRKMDQINAQTAATGENNVQAALDLIMDRAAKTGYLHGDQFSLADLTAAALLFPVAIPLELSFEIPERARRVLGAWQDRWIHHPGTDWVQKMFREYRNADPRSA